MMKQLFLALLIALPFASQSQSFENLEAPSMPAATLIGSQVNEISRPKSFKSLETTLLNNFLDSGNNFVLPSSFALEFNPYLLTNLDSSFSYKDFYLGKNNLKKFYQNIYLSAASTTSYIVNDSVSTEALGFGLRWVLLDGKVEESLKNKFLSAEHQYKVEKALLSTGLTLISAYLDTLSDNIPFSLDTLTKFIDDNVRLGSDETVKEGVSVIISTLNKIPSSSLTKTKISSAYEKTFVKSSLPKLEGILDEIKVQRYGWRAEIDGAFSLNFPSNEFEFSTVPRWGFWANLSYHTPKYKSDGKEAGKFEFTGLARWLWNSPEFYEYYAPDSTDFNPGRFFDWGIRTDFKYKKFTAGVEYIYRLDRREDVIFFEGQEYSRDINNDSYKFTLNINYNIKDNIVLSYNIGKGYGFVNSTRGNLISGLTVNFGFGDIKPKDVIKDF